MLWHSPIGAVASPFSPVFMGQNIIPEEFMMHRYLTVGESHRFSDERKKNEKDTVSLISQGVESTVSAVYECKRLLYLILQNEKLFLPVTTKIFENREKNIWKYLVASNLIVIDKLEDPETIKKYEVAANEGTFEKEKIFEIYMSIPFNINQLINASTIYQGLEGYEGRALIYQRALLSDNVENKLKLLMLLKDLFEKEKLTNIFKEHLSDTLKSIDSDSIPDDYLSLIHI